MTRFSVLSAALAVTSALATVAPALAQVSLQGYQPQTVPSPTPDADALAASMRRLADNPRDLGALITAGELSLKVGDASGAAALFKRAENVDPMNGRIKAGMARILVTQERPGEALRYFDQAVGYGLDPRTFAGDRGLAYDLIGEQERAQRDYRQALKSGDSDEVRRRYALSLGISGKQDAALGEIDTLLRRGDRGAWRARAFILAMTGDVPGATQIATRMMPPGMAQGLQPFFDRLPTLSATDKAFAVHFGEVRPTPQRLADARLTPVLPVLGPDPDARVQVAAAPVAAAPAPVQRGRDRRRRSSPPAVLVASAAPKVTALPPAPGFGAVGESPTQPARVAAAPAAAGALLAQTAPVAARPAPVQLAAAAPIRAPEARSATPPTARPTSAEPTLLSGQAPVTGVSVRPTATTPLAAAPPPAVSAPTGAAPATTTPAAFAAAQPGSPATATPTFAAPPAAPQPVPPAAAPAAVAATPSPSSVPTALRASEDSILARIVAGLTVPGSELGVGPPPVVERTASTVAPPPPEPVRAAPVAVAKPAAPARQPAAAVAEATPTKASNRREALAGVAKPAPSARSRGNSSVRTEITDDAPEPRTTRKGRAGTAKPVELAEADRDEAPRGARGRSTRGRAVDEADAKPIGRRDKRALAAADEDTPGKGARRGKADKRELAAADADDAPKSKKSGRRGEDAKAAKDDVPKIWVQVAGGANEKDLPKAWSAVQSRAAALKGRQAYATPLRATNRVVTGPFKTDAEARAFVNQLAKQGVSAFPFTSDKGQKLTKLPPR